MQKNFIYRQTILQLAVLSDQAAQFASAWPSVRDVPSSIPRCDLIQILRLRAVSYFSLQSYSKRDPITRAAINEGVTRLVLILYCNITTWFAIALAENWTNFKKKRRTASSLSISFLSV